MIPRISLRKALGDPALLGRSCAGPSWAAWRVLIIAALGERLTDSERVIFTELTGRDREPESRVTELCVVAGRRGGKTRALATLATYFSALCDHRRTLASGEVGVLLCLAQDQRVAKKMLDFCQDDLERSPLLRQLLVGRTHDAIDLSNRVRIEVRPASFRKLRGPTYIAVIADELAFWYVEENYTNPDVEVLAAARPGLLTTRGPLIMASSPYARRGVLWDTFRKHYGPEGSPSVLVARGATRAFNPTVPEAEIERLLDADRARNTAEYLAEFRSDIETFLALDAVEAAVGGHAERPPVGATSYRAFVDAAGGSGGDAFTVAVGHREGDRVVVDAVRERRPPFSPAAVVAEFCALLKSYRVLSVNGDRYAGGFPPEAFRGHGISYQAAARPKSDLYADLLPLLNSGRVVLPRNDRLVHQLVALERRTARGTGRDIIDHPPGGHDDLANVVAGVSSMLAMGSSRYDTSLDWVSGPDFDASDAWQASRLWDHIRGYG